MKYDIVTSHMYTQQWIVEADSKDSAEELFKKCKIEWSKELRKYVVRYVTPDVVEGLVTIPDAELRAIMPVPGQNKPTFTKLNE
jgi:hypothetical protein